MQPKTLLMLALALGCGLVAAIGVTQIVSGSGDKENLGSGEVTPIYVALEDIEMGRPINVEGIKLEDWPKDKVPAGALSQLEDVEGRAPRAKIFAGEPILEFKLLTKGEMGDGADIMIPKDYRVIPVSVDEVSGGASMILPGNRVDVYLHVQKSAEFHESMVKQILQNVKVFAVGDTWSRTYEDERTMRAKTVSLLLLPTQAMKVTLAAETGKLSLVLRSPEDDLASDVEKVSVGELFSDSELANTNKDSNILYAENESAENKQQLLELLKGDSSGMPAAPETWNARLLSGQKVLDFSLELEGNRASDSSPGKTGSSGFWKMTTPLDNSTEEPSSGTQKTVKKTVEAAESDGPEKVEEKTDDVAE